MVGSAVPLEKRKLQQWPKKRAAWDGFEKAREVQGNLENTCIRGGDIPFWRAGGCTGGRWEELHPVSSETSLLAGYRGDAKNVDSNGVPPLDVRAPAGFCAVPFLHSGLKHSDVHDNMDGQIAAVRIPCTDQTPPACQRHLLLLCSSPQDVRTV
eukprot:gene12291-biopygen404